MVVLWKSGETEICTSLASSTPKPALKLTSAPSAMSSKEKSSPEPQSKIYSPGEPLNLASNSTKIVPKGSPVPLMTVISTVMASSNSTPPAASSDGS